MDPRLTPLTTVAPARPASTVVLLRPSAERFEVFLMRRPHNIAFNVDLLEIEPGGSPNDLIAGRVVLILNET